MSSSWIEIRLSLRLGAVGSNTTIRKILKIGVGGKPSVSRSRRVFGEMREFRVQSKRARESFLCSFFLSQLFCVSSVAVVKKELLNHDSATSLSLLARLRQEPTDERGWDEFVARYRPRIHQWCRRWGLNQSDADDVCQNVMLMLAQHLRKFEYDPGGKFKAWLRTVARRAWYDYSRRRKKLEFQHDSAVWTALTTKEAGDDLLDALVEECNRELLQCAMQRVQARVQEHTWKAFYMTEFDELPVEEVAKRLSINKGSVYVARGRVQRLLVAEIERLDKIPDAAVS